MLLSGYIRCAQSGRYRALNGGWLASSDQLPLWESVPGYHRIRAVKPTRRYPPDPRRNHASGRTP